MQRWTHQTHPVYSTLGCTQIKIELIYKVYALIKANYFIYQHFMLLIDCSRLIPRLRLNFSCLNEIDSMHANVLNQLFNLNSSQYSYNMHYLSSHLNRKSQLVMADPVFIILLQIINSFYFIFTYSTQILNRVAHNRPDWSKM